MSDDEMEDALWKLGGYSPESVAVQETIAALRAENERLREAVEKIAGLPCGRFAEGFSSNCLAAGPSEPCGPCRARAALAAPQEEGK